MVDGFKGLDGDLGRVELLALLGNQAVVVGRIRFGHHGQAMRIVEQVGADQPAQEAGATGVRIKSEVPLSEMFGYIGDLRTMTSGRGQFSMEFSHYLPCPKSVAEAIIKEVSERNAAK